MITAAEFDLSPVLTAAITPARAIVWAYAHLLPGGVAVAPGP